MGAENGRECLVQTIRTKCRDVSQPPILAFPEGAVTSGKRGLLKFSTWPFESADSVQPVVLRIHRLLFSDLAPSTLGSIWWHDIAFFIFAPMTIVKIHWLPPIHRQIANAAAGDQAEESVEEYANRVAKTMADYAGFVVTNLTCEDVVLEREREERELTASNKLQRKNGKVSTTQHEDQIIVSSGANPLDPRGSGSVCIRRRRESRPEGTMAVRTTAINNTDTDVTRLRVEDLCTVERYPQTFFQSYLLMLYTPIGFVIALLRFFIGLHLFIIACLLRKTNYLRSIVLRATMIVLGIHVVNTGPAKHWDKKTRMIVSNHVTPLDHVAIDLIQPCLLPSSWEIHGFLRWVLGYTEMGAENGRECLVQTIRTKCRDVSQPPILAFPEGAVTSGKRGLLKFSTWPFESADSVQPVVLRIHRLLFSDLAPSTLGSIWWHDIAFFIFAPMTIVKIHWLPPIHRQIANAAAGDQAEESVEEYANRVAKTMADYAGFVATNLTCEDVVDAALQRQAQLEREREERELAASNKLQRKNGKVSTTQLDEWAMKIKQSYPQVRIHSIREDLARTLCMQSTEERIKAGRLDTASRNVDIRLSQHSSSAPLKNTPGDFRSLYDERKWTMVERNREKYLERLSIATNFDDDDEDSILGDEQL